MSVPVTAVAHGLYSCHVCNLVSHAGQSASASACPRCGAYLHFRKPHSISRTWALLIAAYVLYLPANMLPIMDTNSLFDAQQDTILSGVIFLWDSGSWPTALLVFFASIVVPLFKIVALTILVVSVQRRSVWRPHVRTRLYRVVEFLGRWSMLDIYVVAILVALVQIQSLAVIHAGSGAIAFGAVVILTMFAAFNFDPRLIWDPLTIDE